MSAEFILYFPAKNREKRSFTIIDGNITEKNYNFESTGFNSTKRLTYYITHMIYTLIFADFFLPYVCFIHHSFIHSLDFSFVHSISQNSIVSAAEMISMLNAIVFIETSARATSEPL